MSHHQKFITSLIPSEKNDEQIICFAIKSTLKQNTSVPYAVGLCYLGVQGDLISHWDYLCGDSDEMLGKFFSEIFQIKNVSKYTLVCQDFNPFTWTPLFDHLLANNAEINKAVADEDFSLTYLEVIYHGHKLSFKNSTRLLGINTPNGGAGLEPSGLEELKEELNDTFARVMNLSNTLTSIYGTKLKDVYGQGSIAYRVFRTKFIGNAKIPLLDSKVDEFIRKAYHSVTSDVFLPYGRNLYFYDCNSLFPSAMLECMPEGQPRPITTRELSKLFGFVRVKVECPAHIQIPLLPVNRDDKLITPTGKWEGIYFTEELKLAQKIGYKVKVLDGYNFYPRKSPLADYVSHFYELKKNSVATPLRPKLVLNSLYGKLAGPLSYPQTSIVDYSEFKTLLGKKELLDYRRISDTNRYLTRCMPLPRQRASVRSGTCIAIAAAITAHARMKMWPLKTLKGNQCYYSDVDSLVLSKPLPLRLVGDGIGKFRNVLRDENYDPRYDRDYYADEAYFLGLKSYGFRSKIKSVGRIHPFGEVGFERVKESYDSNTLPELTHRLRAYDNEKWVDTCPIQL